MKKLLLNRWTFAVLGLVLLLAVIWLLGPYFAFGSARPMESATGRVIATLILLLVWVAAMLWRTWRETRGSRKLVAEVTQQADAPMVGEARPTDSADVSQLRQRFDDAVTRLKKDRRGGGNLYRLPWYVIIGPPGSGKTTALVNSGLRFPMEQEVGRRAIKGVGGTRNCDWWFTDEAVLLDTAGRYHDPGFGSHRGRRGLVAVPAAAEETPAPATDQRRARRLQRFRPAHAVARGVRCAT